MEGAVRIGLLGVGRIGRELIRRTSGKPGFRYVALGDTSGVIARKNPFTKKELDYIIRLKDSGGQLEDFGGNEHYDRCEDSIGCYGVDAFVDATDAQTYDLLYDTLEHSSVLLCNKIPIADVSYSRFRKLVSKASDEGRTLDFGTTVGAGMRIPDIVGSMGSDGLDRLTGCLSGTMNYVSQRVNEGRPLSVSIREAMEPPRCYAEPDPRVDLGGEDFARKLVIIGRACGRGVERNMVDIEGLIPDQLRELPVEEFLDRLDELDPGMRTRVKEANREGRMCWYLGSADLQRDEYSIGFEDVPIGDSMARSRESDNVLKIVPRGWRRVVTIIGPGAGPPETVTGLIHGLNAISNTRVERPTGRVF